MYMNNSPPLIMVVDDDPDTRNLIEHILRKNGYDVISAADGLETFTILKNSKPDLILLDVSMPGMNGYEVCRKLQADQHFAYIPVIFITAFDQEQNRERIFSSGGVDYLIKPINREELIKKIDSYIKTKSRWQKIEERKPSREIKSEIPDFVKFKKFLINQLKLDDNQQYLVGKASIHNIYSICKKIDITTKQLAQYLADFTHLPFISYIDHNLIELDVLPPAFCRANYVLPVIDEKDKICYIICNPFDVELVDLLTRLGSSAENRPCLKITSPEVIDAFLRSGMSDETAEEIAEVAVRSDPDKTSGIEATKTIKTDLSTADITKYPVMHIANNILITAVSERASDIHIEPKKNETVVRFRVDGDMHEMFTLKKRTGLMLINRLKVLADMDITEKRRPQDGTLEAVINKRIFKLRLATTSTPEGESLIIRLLEPHAKPKSLGELGMTSEQVEILLDIINRSHGLILIVGPTGSGKTTTIYSLLSQVDCRSRSLVSIEDPVEYRIPFANQQQVNEKAGVTFEALLKSVVRQDPDIIFLGEIRDQYSAKMAMNFSSTGHLTISTLHTSNTTTAIFRLERLGITREVMAEALICIIAQRLVKKLCPFCKKITEPSDYDLKILRPFVDKEITKVAKPVGCPRCNNSGYKGREGIYEILKFDYEITEMVRQGTPIAEIRELIRKKGHYLISNHAVEKVQNLIFSPEDVYKAVLAEDMKSVSLKKEESKKAAKEEKTTAPSILIVDDDPEIGLLLKQILKKNNYDITYVEDGVDALMQIGSKKFDLVISDVNMPNLDGFKLLEIIKQKGIDVPVVFLTARTEAEDEIKGLELGAVDYIKKPIKKQLLLLKISRLLGKGGNNE